MTSVDSTTSPRNHGSDIAASAIEILVLGLVAYFLDSPTFDVGFYIFTAGVVVRTLLSLHAAFPRSHINLTFGVLVVLTATAMAVVADVSSNVLVGALVAGGVFVGAGLLAPTVSTVVPRELERLRRSRG